MRLPGVPGVVPGEEPVKCLLQSGIPHPLVQLDEAHELGQLLPQDLDSRRENTSTRDLVTFNTAVALVLYCNATVTLKK